MNLNLSLGGLALVFLVPNLVWAACDQTLSPGASVASAVANAPAGSTICLNGGSYGSVSITNANKATPVTLQSTSGRTASIFLNITQSSGLVLKSMTLTGLSMAYQAKNISVLGNTFTGQLLINMGGNGGNYGNANILIDGNSFDNISVCANCYEGRIQVISNLPCGVTISNNHFGGPGESDGIQVGAVGLKIGPGNVFDGIIQGNYGRHVDSIQLYGQSNTTITGNYFINGDVGIMAPDGGDSEIITHNVFVGRGAAIQLGSHVNDQFLHNTVIGMDVHISKKTERPDSSANVIVRNNIMVGNGFSTRDSNGQEGCVNCTFDRNLYSLSGSARGTNTLIGSPTFIGGSQPSSWAGYQLAASSLGYRAATDGNDVGSNYFGSGSTPAPSPSPSSSPSPSPTVTPSPTPTTSPSPTPAPSPISGTSQSLLAGLTPALVNQADGVSYELGMKFSSNVSGQITAIRFYKGSAESGTHTGKIYSASGALLRSVTFSGETASGWQQMNFATPLAIAAGTTYVVTVNTGNTYYVATNGGFNSARTVGNLTAPIGAGVYGPVGSMPTTVWSNSNYFRDIVFVAGSSTPTTTTTVPPVTTTTTTQPPVVTTTTTTTIPPSVDTTPPSTSITSPVNGGTVPRNTTITISATASDNVGVTRVEFYVNGALKCTDTSASYSCSWKVPGANGKNYQLQSRAYDARGNMGGSSIVNVTSR